MLLSEIWIYPVKSLGGIRLSSAQVEERGLQHDRRWMLVDESGLFISQRENTKMALLDVSLHEDGLTISHRFETGNQVFVPYKPNSASYVIVKVWDDLVNAITVSTDADAWLSEQLDQKVRIVMMPDSTERKADPRYALNGETVSFADGYPFLLISEASLADLNSRLEKPVEMIRFRPNFVITEASAYEEDSWKSIQIGSIFFEGVKPCGRCILTTIDPMTGEKGTEPLKTLAFYRKVNSKVLFGQNLVTKGNGVVREGDEIRLL
jgi:uncharacterized protein YcbX